MCSVPMCIKARWKTMRKWEPVSAVMPTDMKKDNRHKYKHINFI